MFVAYHVGFPGGTSSKEPPANAGGVRDVGSTSGLGRYPGGGQSNPLQYSCLTSHETEEPGGLWSMGWQRVRDDRSDLAHTAYCVQGEKTGRLYSKMLVVLIFE